MRNELIEKYIDFEININNRRSGRVRMRHTVKKLFKYLEDTETDIYETGLNDARGYIVWLKETGYSNGMIKNFLAAAIGFYSYLKKQGKIIENPFIYIKRFKQRKSLPKEILKEEEMIKLLNSLLNFEDKRFMCHERRNYKNHLISEVFYSTGIRVNEMANIKEEDIDFINGTIKIDDTKGGRRRTVFLNDYAKEILWIYVTEVRKWLPLVSKSRDKLFATGRDQMITVFNRDLKKACKKAGVPAISSHSFRHSVGYQLLKAGCDIRYIQEILGHKDIENTEIYTRIDNDNLRKVVIKHHPRNIRIKI